jgi:hypothetical protein
LNESEENSSPFQHDKVVNSSSSSGEDEAEESKADQEGMSRVYRDVQVSQQSIDFLQSEEENNSPHNVARQEIVGSSANNQFL